MEYLNVLMAVVSIILGVVSIVISLKAQKDSNMINQETEKKLIEIKNVNDSILLLIVPYTLKLYKKLYILILNHSIFCI